VNTNGVVSFSARVEAFTPEAFPLSGSQELIAPFWADVDTRNTPGGGSIWYRDTADPSVLSRARSEISRAFVDHQDFNPVYAIIATWDHVGYYNRQIDKASVQDKLISCILHFNFRPFTALVQTSQPEIYIKLIVRLIFFAVRLTHQVVRFP